MPKPLVLTLPLTSCSPATLRRLQPALVAAACAGKMLNGSGPAAASGRLDVMPGRPPARHSAGGAGIVASGVDGGGDQWASRARVILR